jgi:hypothetical protein
MADILGTVEQGLAAAPKLTDELNTAITHFETILGHVTGAAPKADAEIQASLGVVQHFLAGVGPALATIDGIVSSPIVKMLLGSLGSIFHFGTPAPATPSTTTPGPSVSGGLGGLLGGLFGGQQ